ncbi:MAG: hypothetical protein ACR2QC_08545 [Gammaproteobacteria bacterium]
MASSITPNLDKSMAAPMDQMQGNQLQLTENETQVDRVFQRFSAQEKDSENSTSILFLSDASLCRVFSFLDVPSG